ARHDKVYRESVYRAWYEKFPLISFRHKRVTIYNDSRPFPEVDNNKIPVKPIWLPGLQSSLLKRTWFDLSFCVIYHSNQSIEKDATKKILSEYMIQMYTQIGSFR